ncbi:MAG: hypothetical protein BV459_01925 [Thermoplasmata archaeon M11B2D]|nr:MAG: hypothetical protein BV459_01925 [Thermoplasmata archaeon M11B2D]
MRNMRKITTIGMCFVFLGVSIASAAADLTQQHPQCLTIDPTGTFQGNIGIPEHQGQNETIVGTINGSYWLRVRGGRFTSDWQTDNRTGTIRGVFGRHLLVGRISTMVNDTERSLPIVGFLKAQNYSFIGRFMAPVGPALYFWGTYT